MCQQPSELNKVSNSPEDGHRKCLSCAAHDRNIGRNKSTQMFFIIPRAKFWAHASNRF